VSRRTAWIVALAFGTFVFLGISFMLARGLSASGAERAQVLDALQAQARGDAAGVLAELPACARQPLCVRVTRDRVARLRWPGEVQILNYRPSIGLALTRQVGTGRVAWRTPGRLPVVQCVRVRRDGPLTGGGVELLALTDPIGAEASC
jgi:hypothetical protein